MGVCSPGPVNRASRKAWHPSCLVWKCRTQASRQDAGSGKEVVWLFQTRQRCNQQSLAISHGPLLTHTVTEATSPPHAAWSQCSDERDELRLIQVEENASLPSFFCLFLPPIMCRKPLKSQHSPGQSYAGIFELCWGFEFFCLVGFHFLFFFCFFFSSRWNELKVLLKKKIRMQNWRSVVSRCINKQAPNLLSLMVFGTILNSLKRITNIQQVIYKIPNEAI